LSKTKQERDNENNLHTTEYARAGNQKYYINANYAIKKIETWDGNRISTHAVDLYLSNLNESSIPCFVKEFTGPW
jgi:hypothetical protein